VEPINQGLARLKSAQAQPWVHFVAIGGTGMGSLAGLLKQQDVFVTGSDGPLYPPMSTFLDELKIPRVEGYSERNLEGPSWGLPQGRVPDLVIVGNAVSRPNVEAQKTESLMGQGLSARMSFAQALAEFGIADRKSFVVCGTHGKTTTTSICAWALESLGLKPGFFVGGIPKNFGLGCRPADGPVFVSEGDEYDTAYWDKESKFLHYRPSWVLCTGVEFDHADIYQNLDQIVASFLKLVPLTKNGWVLIDEQSAPKAQPIQRIREAVLQKGIALASYGLSANSDYQLVSVSPASQQQGTIKKFGLNLKLKLKKFGATTVFSPMAGEHNALNTLGVIAMLIESGEITKTAEIQKFLDSFLGVTRRQDEVARRGRVIVIDDFAHHPTAIRETIRALKTLYQGAPIAAFFEARSATSSRNIFYKEFLECFDDASAVFLSPPTKTNIPDDQKLDIGALTLDLRKRLAPKTVECEAQLDTLVQKFHSWVSRQSGQDNLVALVMSNGPFQGIHARL
jgi:UDP-N-acetylmuramate: L-alanyl-gamma-D-glutamyl-meso-diaminopimelate ligase